ncbi:MAG: hypothetical protein NTV58_14840 [Deltaproteobacteria bacterium]|nr:hypothetical protein [Deltaproteobacteria bacterium]
MKKESFFTFKHLFIISIGIIVLLELFLGCTTVTKSNIQPNKSPTVQNGRTSKVRIAVVGFDVATSTYGIKHADRKAEDMLTTALIRTKQFQVVDRKRIQNVFDEQKFQMSGMVDTATAVKIGKILGVQAIVTGSITEMGCSAASFIAKMTTCRASMDVQVINVETAEIVSAETGEGTSKSVVHYDAQKALNQKDAELWVSEALRSASEDAASKIAKIAIQ